MLKISLQNMSTLQIRGIDSLIKEKAESVFRQLGITTSSAIKMYLNQIAMTGGIPFSPTTHQNNLSPQQEENILNIWKNDEEDEFKIMKECISDLKS